MRYAIIVVDVGVLCAPCRSSYMMKTTETNCDVVPSLLWMTMTTAAVDAAPFWYYNNNQE